MAKHKRSNALPRPRLPRDGDDRLAQPANPLREPQARWQRFRRYTWDKQRG